MAGFAMSWRMAVAGLCFSIVSSLAAPVLAIDEPSVTTASYGKWVLTCHSASGDKVCEVDQNVVDTQGQSVLRVRVGELVKGSNKTSMLIEFPVNFTTAEAFAVTGPSIDLKPELRACLQVACFADAPLSKADIARFEATPSSAKVAFNMTTAAGKKLSLPMSLDGFKSAWAALNAKPAH